MAADKKSFLGFFWLAVHIQWTRWPPRKELMIQLVESGWGSMGLLTLLAAFSGLNLSVQSYGAFIRFGGQDMIGTFAAVGGVRELYPMLAAVVCGARIGANLAASLANMRMSEQVDALEVMGVDPLHFLISPRIWAVCLALPLLCGYAIAVGLLSSYGAAVFQFHLDPGSFVSQIQEQVTLVDLGVGMFKGLVMGWLIAVIACFQGFCVDPRLGVEGVGLATNRAIVQSAVMVIVLNLCLSYAIYGA